MTNFLEMGHDRISSKRDVTATIPVSRIGSGDCPRGNEPLAPRNRCLAPDLRPWPMVARRILVRHFERDVARNKLIIIVIEIFLVQTSTPRGLFINLHELWRHPLRGLPFIIIIY